MLRETEDQKVNGRQEVRRWDQAEAEPRTSRRRLLRLLVVVTALAACVLAIGIVLRLRERRAVREVTAQMADPSVSVVTPKRSAPAQEIVLPGDVEPFVSSPIYSRTNGYLRKWYADIGTHVKKGQLLAVIETPEVDQQLEQSRSDLMTAQANLKLAEITMNRYQGLLKSHAVSQQDADNATGTYNANKAIVEANQAKVKQLEALQSFEKIYAPFDGIVTARNTDVGDLINAGSTGSPKTDLFHISQPDKLRVYVSVPEEYSRAAKPGLKAELALAEFPGQRFQGTLVRTSEAIIKATRTLLVEIAVDNPTGTLLSGSYAEVHLRVPDQNSSYLIPVNALIFRSQGLQVALVKDGRVVLQKVTPGHDFGDQIEILAGLNAGDQVIVNPPDSITAGEAVQVVPATIPGASK
jgi:RND family efflux transporter MFP subunit